MRPTAPHAALILALVILCAAPAGGAMRETMSTAKLLSGLVDARVVQMDLPRATPTPPKRIYSLVIAFDGVLWLYTPGLGTSILGSLSSADALRQENIADRLRQLEPTARNVRVYSNPALPSIDELSLTLSQACFAGCLLDLANLLSRTATVDHAGIIFFSDRGSPSRFQSAPGLTSVGHSLLVYRIAGQWLMVDPARPAQPFPLSGVDTETALDPALAAYASRSGYPVEHVRFLPFSSSSLSRLAREARWREHLFAPLPEN